MGALNGILGITRVHSRGINHFLAMNRFFIFIFTLFFALFHVSSFAQEKCYEYRRNSSNPWVRTMSAVCSAWASGLSTANAPRVYSVEKIVGTTCHVMYTSTDGTVYRFSDSAMSREIPCPDNCVAPLEKDASGKCSCPAGTKEETDANGLRQCKPDSVCSEMAGKPLGLPVTADYGSKSPSALGRMIGNSSTTCFPGGCSVSGTVSGCWSAKGVAGCNLTDAKFTGDKCDDKAPPGGCPSGSSPSQYAAGVCIPDENKCPAGSSPSKYASGVCIPDQNPCPAGQAPSKYAAGVCVPKDDPNADGNGETGNNSKCPPGRVESRYAAGVCVPADTTVGDGSGGGGGTTCKDGKCTTTNPDGSTDEKPEQEFCKENPDAPQCKKSNWGGSCGSFTCDGDAIQCAIAREQHQRNCKLFDEKTSHPAYQAAVDGTDEQSADKLKAKAEQISVAANLDQSGFGWAKGCPPDPEIALGFVQQSFTIPFSRICGPLEALSLAGVGITLLGCMVWVIGG